MLAVFDKIVFSFYPPDLQNFKSPLKFLKPGVCTHLAIILLKLRPEGRAGVHPGAGAGGRSRQRKQSARREPVVGESTPQVRRAEAQGQV